MNKLREEIVKIIKNIPHGFYYVEVADELNDLFQKRLEEKEADKHQAMEDTAKLYITKLREERKFNKYSEDGWESIVEDLRKQLERKENSYEELLKAMDEIKKEIQTIGDDK